MGHMGGYRIELVVGGVMPKIKRDIDYRG